ncbi:hypothetical protein E2C01_094718 [Portunus trituberculatus]|uniref:Uncharacterized protein n=1 Tax=Portunus trituberculatus TaxID=210409 RepID=A0A5B7JT41_PORTR|nr:hypothetical protein [Portunus trituberculatus]
MSGPLLSVITNDALPSEQRPQKLLRRVERGDREVRCRESKLNRFPSIWRGKQVRSGTGVHIIHEEAVRGPDLAREERQLCRCSWREFPLWIYTNTI